ncbi:MAG: LacI family DNA-binding transcriptional regulator [Firmicutes bacterium]|nr:LacI family DNA-binding transcriptional regulator [Bacillota bacterium]
MPKHRSEESRVKLKDIAEAAGVSISTVSRALSGHDSVSAKKRKEIMEIAKETGYIASGKETDRVLIAVGLPNADRYALRNPYFLEIIRGAYTVINRFSRLHLTIEDLSRLPELVGVTDGLLVLSPDDVHFDFERVRQLPTVVVDSLGPEWTVSVVVDNAAGTRMATEHVILLGHQRVAYIGPRNTRTAEERYEGYVKAHRDHNLTVGSDMAVFTRDSSFEEGYKACRELLSHERWPTAIVAFNDYMAWGVLSCCQEHGVKVPEDISLVGYDGIAQFPVTALTRLTTVDQHAFEQGYTAANVLIDLLSGHRPNTSVIQVTPNIVLGSTVVHPHELRELRGILQ